MSAPKLLDIAEQLQITTNHPEVHLIVLLEEFKGTGNSEIHLGRRITEKRVYPAIGVNLFGPRREVLHLAAIPHRAVYCTARVQPSCVREPAT